MPNLHTYLHPGVKGMQNRHLPPLLRFIPQFAQICIIFALSKFVEDFFFVNLCESFSAGCLSFCRKAACVPSSTWNTIARKGCCFCRVKSMKQCDSQQRDDGLNWEVCVPAAACSCMYQGHIFVRWKSLDGGCFKRIKTSQKGYRQPKLQVKQS